MMTMTSTALTTLTSGPWQTALQRLDLLLHREILRLRANYQLSSDEFRGLYVSDDLVDAQIRAGIEMPDAPDAALLTDQAERLHADSREALMGYTPWQHLSQEFNLNDTEQDLILIALAPELDLKYETLYAYLNNDITRKWPTCDLALRLLTDSSQTAARQMLLPQGKLFDDGLLQFMPSPTDRPHTLARGFRIHPTALNCLLGTPHVDPELHSCLTWIMPRTTWAEVPVSVSQREALQRIAEHLEPNATLILEGRAGLGQTETTQAICTTRDLSLLRLISDKVPNPNDLPTMLHLHQRLLNAALSIEITEPSTITTLLQHPSTRPVMLQNTGSTRPTLERQATRIRFEEPDAEVRRECWQAALHNPKNALEPDLEQALTPEDLNVIADRYRLGPSEIRNAAQHALQHCRINGTPLNLEALSTASLDQGGQALSQLATRVPTPHQFSDLILPNATLQRVQELAHAINHQHTVYTTWGFGHRITNAKGLKVLFSGTSGTGKTMTAGVIARSVGLELYKIDLSSVVSKYIGETEKNLETIFRAAHGSNAILFFDEADALFGKRSEVKDAHDRYANIEVAYLLQRIEAHEGVVILATNLSKNIDEAFARRMHTVIEFPLPDDAHREHLWRSLIPNDAPLSEDVDLPFMAKHFEIAGGDIQNVVLEAAFLATRDAHVIGMKHLVKAMARQMLKQKRVPTPADFKQYHSLIAQE
jgi:ATPase family associated with various cellular activities (AAA)